MYTKRRYGLDLEARLVEDFDGKAVARWAVGLLRERDDLDPDLAHSIAKTAAIAEEAETDRGTHALRSLARLCSGKGADYRPGALRDRRLFEILDHLLSGPENFESLLRRLHRGFVGELDGADLAARLERLVALGWVDAGLVRGGQFRALGRLEAQRVLLRPDGYHFSLNRAGSDAWSDYSCRDQEPTPPARARL